MRAWLTYLMLVIVAACGADSTPGDLPETWEPAAPRAMDAPTAMPRELRAAYIAAVQAGASEQVYGAAVLGPGELSVDNAAQRLTAILDVAGMEVTSSEADWSLSVRTAALGCAGAARALPDVAPEVDDADTKRVRYVHEDLETWYLNGPLGIEQGFVVAQAPACRGTKVIVLELGGALRPALEDEDGDGRGDTLDLVDDAGGRPLRYTDLFVKDATGKDLPAWLSVDGGQVAIHVDDADAVYPIEIDPLLSSPQGQLVPGGQAYDEFGYSVAIAGDTAIVGARYDDVGANADQGTAYVFVRSGTSWAQQAQLVAENGAANDYFGYSVALAGDTAVVGAPYGSAGRGTAYMFVRSGTHWSQQAQVIATAAAHNDYFGFSVAIAGDTAVVGAPFDDVGANRHQGSACVFVRSGTYWSQHAQLVATGGAANDNFGWSVAIVGDMPVVGAPLDDVGANTDQGSAYVFARSGARWSQQAQLVATDGAAGDNFGYSVALAGDTAVVGAYYDDVGANANQGSAYVFVRSETSWAQQAQLVATDGAADDRFGRAVALAGDTAVVGAYYDDVGANANQGSAYVFVRSGTSWAQQAQLVATDGATTDSFGSSVALAGDTAVVGAPSDDVGTNANQGSAYVFTSSGTSWSQQAQLAATDGAATDSFGNSVAIAGDTAVVGAPFDEVGIGANENQGTAYVFVRSGTSWAQQAQLVATNGAASDNFGWSVALAGNIAVVGAPFVDVGANADQGSAYVFVRGETRWIQQAQLVAADGAASDNFGSSVAIAGNTAVVGAPSDDVGTNADQGSAYVFVRSETSWSQQAQLVAADGAADDRFGRAVAIAGDTAVVGAPSDDVGTSTDQGSAYVFVRGETIWSQQAQLVAADGAASDSLGESVAIVGDTAVVGAPSDDVGANTDQGSAYVFVRSETIWSQQAQLVAADGAASDSLGESVAIVGDTAVVGAPLDDVDANTDQGSAYVFVRSETSWSQQAQLVAAGGATEDRFGSSVAIAGDTAVVGAPFDDVDANTDQGSAYPFRLLKVGSACASSAGCATGFCVDGVCCNTACGGGASNDCQACSVAAGAAVDGICAPAAAGTQCRGAEGDCDVAEACDGESNSCPADTKAAAGTTCRDAAGDCDVAEACDGESNSCPADTKAAAGTTCRGAEGDCDMAEACDGASNSCPTDTKAAAGTTCRGAAGDCDVAEACDGESNGCPADTKVAAGTTCRGAEGDCDVVEACDGVAGTCPADASAPDGTTCPDGTCVAGTCLGGAGSGGGGDGGSAGASGDGGSAGASGDGGSAGASGDGGSAGASGDGGSAGDGGDGGSAGDGGSTGDGGDGGSTGDGGDGGSTGDGGDGGSAGDGGDGGSSVSDSSTSTSTSGCACHTAGAFTGASPRAHLGLLGLGLLVLWGRGRRAPRRAPSCSVATGSA
ncbi:hypothetical protein [Sorangium sp. So ce426]|uniref:hypothetical protein n=1 Tax=Sorangium sp. So ce426 TaxID=3133312 RepID=UPI003F5C280B